MLIRETAKSAWRSLTSNRLRTLLTMLGMIIGTGAVVAVLGIGEGAKSSVEGRANAASISGPTMAWIERPSVSAAARSEPHSVSRNQS